MPGDLDAAVAAAITAHPGLTVYELTCRWPAEPPVDDGALFPRPPVTVPVDRVLQAVKRLRDAGLIREAPQLVGEAQCWQPTGDVTQIVTT